MAHRHVGQIPFFFFGWPFLPVGPSVNKLITLLVIHYYCTGNIGTVVDTFAARFGLKDMVQHPLPSELGLGFNMVQRIQPLGRQLLLYRSTLAPLRHLIPTGRPLLPHRAAGPDRGISLLPNECHWAKEVWDADAEDSLGEG